jgi:hypothetical protein
MRGATPPLPQYVFMAWCSVKHRDNFTFLPLPSSVAVRAGTRQEDQATTVRGVLHNGVHVWCCFVPAIILHSVASSYK